MDFDSGTSSITDSDRLSWQFPTGNPSPQLEKKMSVHQNGRRWLMKKTLFHQTVRAGICQEDGGAYRYRIAVIHLASEEKEICRSVHQELIKKRDSSLPLSQQIFPSRKIIHTLISEMYPLLSDEKKQTISSALFFHYDPTRWVRLLILESDISGIFCPGPDAVVLVRYHRYKHLIQSNIRLRRSHLDRLAQFFLSAAGIRIGETDIPNPIRLDNGVCVALKRQGDSEGWSWRIEILKARPEKINLSEIQTASSLPKNEARNTNLSSVPNRRSASNPSKKQVVTLKGGVQKPAPNIEELLNTIFSKEAVPSNHSTGGPIRLDMTTSAKSTGFLDAILSPLKRGFSLGTISGKRSEAPSHDPPPVPDTLQAPSVLNIQTAEGVVAEEAYWLFQPHAYVAILQDQNKDRRYHIVEPDLTPRERIILEETHETLRDVLVYDKPVSKGDLFLDYSEVAKVVRTYDPHITEDRLSVLYYYLKRNLNGYGKIDPLMYDELLEDISCNGHNLPVYIHHRYYGSIPTSVRFESEELNRFVLKLSQKADKQVSLTSPLLDASLPNGARAQITYSDVVSTKGSSFTIRKFRSDPMTPATLMAFGTYNDELLAFIWLALENRQSLIVVGGTASGKTSAMNAFSFFIPHNSKIVSLEDTREIQIPQKNWLPVQTRASNTVNDRGSIDLFDLLKASLRQRPEYIIVGEVRGSEAQTLFQAMNSGHTTLSTLHAGNIEEALNRLTNEPINVPPAMFGALNLMVIQTFHYRGGRMIRRCDAIHEIVLGDGDKVGWNTLYEYDPQVDSFNQVYSKSKTLRTIQYMHNWSDEELAYQLKLRAGFLARLRNQYSTDPDILMQMITEVRRHS